MNQPEIKKTCQVNFFPVFVSRKFCITIDVAKEKQPNSVSQRTFVGVA